MLRVYVSGPYTSDPESNTLKALDAGDQLLEAGLAPYIPHLCHYWEARHPHPWQVWLDLDLEWIQACQAMVRLPGESTGADKETALAKQLGIPVFSSVEACLEGLRRRGWVRQTPVPTVLQGQYEALRQRQKTLGCEMETVELDLARVEAKMWDAKAAKSFRCRQPDCNPCEIERIGCACDGSFDDGCFLCSPEDHPRPPCKGKPQPVVSPEKTYEERVAGWDRKCAACDKPTSFPMNYCNWECHIAGAKARGGKEHLPNGLPIMSIRHDGLMLECEHGDHPDYLWLVVARYTGPAIPDEDWCHDETHALIYTDGNLAVTLYETTYYFWLNGNPIVRKGCECPFVLSNETLKKITAYAAKKVRL